MGGGSAYQQPIPLYVDMGLPSKTLWAQANINLNKENHFADSPFSIDCSYFSWGNTEGYSLLNNVFDYNWTEDIYNSTPGAQIAGNIPLDNDAAHINCGLPWRIPSRQDFVELLNNTIFVMADGSTEIPADIVDKRVTVNDVLGIYLKSIHNGNLLFFSAHGQGEGYNVDLSRYVRYWTKTPYSTGSEAYQLNANSSSASVYHGLKYHGLPIRPIIYQK